MAFNPFADVYGPETAGEYMLLRQVFSNGDLDVNDKRIPGLVPFMIHYPMLLTHYACVRGGTPVGFTYLCHLIRSNFPVKLQMRWVIGSLMRIYRMGALWAIADLSRVFTDQCFDWLFRDDMNSGLNVKVLTEMYVNIILTEGRRFAYIEELVDQMALSPTVSDAVKGFLYNNSACLSRSEIEE